MLEPPPQARPKAVARPPRQGAASPEADGDEAEDPLAAAMAAVQAPQAAKARAVARPRRSAQVKVKPGGDDSAGDHAATDAPRGRAKAVPRRRNPAAEGVQVGMDDLEAMWLQSPEAPPAGAAAAPEPFSLLGGVGGLPEAAASEESEDGEEGVPLAELLGFTPRTSAAREGWVTHPAPQSLAEALRPELARGGEVLQALAALPPQGVDLDALPEASRPFVAEAYMREVVEKEVEARLEAWTQGLEKAKKATNEVTERRRLEDAVLAELLAKRPQQQQGRGLCGLDDRIRQVPGCLLKTIENRDQNLRMVDGRRRQYVLPYHRRALPGARAARGTALDLVLMVKAYHPSTQGEVGAFEVRGSDPITTLLDALPCPLHRHLARLGKLPSSSPSGFLYAGGTFYSRQAPGTTDYVGPIQTAPDADPAHRRAPVEPAEAATWGALRVQLHDNLLFRHLGRCDHVLRVTEVRLDDAPDRPLPAQLTAAPQHQAPLCDVCKAVSADHMLLRTPALPEADGFVCDNCLPQLHPPGGFRPPVVPLVHREGY
eukprot:TRINITY_DN12513_c0_g1_i1.p1 TRINITY_DN12513_c0_g1~~TRINITY_DN12513_c0_g1_i1.p1  ORF type:complete len:569 (+),score=175.20 TRINITY_DN12513_c0_g1_i1:78-1709(+)